MGAFGLFRNQAAHNLELSIPNEDRVRVLHFLDFLYRILLNCGVTEAERDGVHNDE